jgi:hypothetical protein
MAFALYTDIVVMGGRVVDAYRHVGTGNDAIWMCNAAAMARRYGPDVVIVAVTMNRFARSGAYRPIPESRNEPYRSYDLGFLIRCADGVQLATIHNPDATEREQHRFLTERGIDTANGDETPTLRRERWLQHALDMKHRGYNNKRIERITGVPRPTLIDWIRAAGGSAVPAITAIEPDTSELSPVAPAHDTQQPGPSGDAATVPVINQIAVGIDTPTPAIVPGGKPYETGLIVGVDGCGGAVWTLAASNRCDSGFPYPPPDVPEIRVADDTSKGWDAVGDVHRWPHRPMLPRDDVDTGLNTGGTVAPFTADELARAREIGWD